ncbi:MAG: ferric reductase-like transmembrane domain-containing protein [Candidatus Nanohalobium sp.]
MDFRSRKELLLVGIYLSSLAIGAVATLASTGALSTYNIGKVLGVWMLTALVFQIVLATRMNLIERGIGYDRITNWHALNGKLIGILVLLHPFLMFKTQIMNLQFNLILTYMVNNPAVLLGVTAVLMILGQILGTLYWKSLDYQIWRKIHMLGYVVVGLGFAHSLLLGTETTIPPDNPLAYYWLFLGLVATVSAGYSLIYRRLWKPQKFELENVKEETEDVTTVELRPLEKDIDNSPGQFAYVKFDSEEVPGEEHHFTVSSSAEKNGISFTVKD